MIAASLALSLVAALSLSGGVQQERPASTTPPARPPVLDHPVRLENPPPAFTAVNRALRASKCIRADFDEQKTIRVLKRPIPSSGSMVLCPELGLYRAVRAPIALEILVTPQGVAQRDASGRVERVQVERQPLAKGFIDAFLLVFSGNEKALAAEFDLFFSGEEQAWTLGFAPKKEPLSRFIASLVVTGHAGVLDTLHVTETNGDSTASRFSNVVTVRELTSDERERWFGWQR